MAQKATFGIFRTREQVENAVDELRKNDFRSEDISVLFSDNVGTKDFAHEMNTKAPEGAAAGATSGAVAGGILGWLFFRNLTANYLFPTKDPRLAGSLKLSN